MNEKDIQKAIESASNIIVDLESIKLLHQRKYNQIYSASGLIVKVATEALKQIEGNRCLREEEFFKIVRSEAPIVPIPYIFAVDTTKQIIPYDFIIMEQKKGEAFNETGKEMSPREKIRISEIAGNYLSYINKIKREGIGFLNNEVTTNWERHILERTRRIFGSIKTNFQATEARAIEEYLKRVRLAFHGSYLLHNDFHIGNWLVDRQIYSLEAVLDGEVAYCGVPEYEIGRFIVYTEDEEIIKGLLTGYSSNRRIDEQELRKYVVITGLELVYLFHDDVKRTSAFKRKILEQI